MSTRTAEFVVFVVAPTLWGTLVSVALYLSLNGPWWSGTPFALWGLGAYIAMRLDD
jgi:hypothetical protein